MYFSQGIVAKIKLVFGINSPVCLVQSFLNFFNLLGMISLSIFCFLRPIQNDFYIIKG